MKFEISDNSVTQSTVESLSKLMQLCHGGGMVDVIVRRDAKETRFQADWIKYMRVLEPYRGNEPRCQKCCASLIAVGAACPDPNCNPTEREAHEQ